MSGTPIKGLETNTGFLTSKRLRGHRQAKTQRSFNQTAAERTLTARPVEAENGSSTAVDGIHALAPSAWQSSATGFE